MNYPHTYQEADALLQGRNSASRKLDHNTYLQHDPPNIKVMLWSHKILTFGPDGSIKLDACGYRTPTTKDRMNKVLQHTDNNWQTYVTSVKGVWYLHQGDHDTGKNYPFADDMTISINGRVDGAAELNENNDKVLRKAISKYAAACADALPLPLPSAEDCRYCSLMTEKDKPLGEAVHDTSHLLLHMEESCVMPALVMHVLLTMGSRASVWGAFPTSSGNSSSALSEKMAGKSSTLEYARLTLKRTMRRYLLRRFGYEA